MDMNPVSCYVFSEVCSLFLQSNIKKLDVFRMSTSHTSCFQEEKHDADFFLMF